MFAPRFDPLEDLRDARGEGVVSNGITNNENDSESDTTFSSDEMEETIEERDNHTSKDRDSEEGSDESSMESDSSSESESGSGEDEDENLKDTESEKMDANEEMDQESVTGDQIDVDDNSELPSEENSKYLAKHGSVFLKYRSSLPQKRPQLDDDDSDSDDTQNIEKQDLKPLPQPELPRDKKLESSRTQVKVLDWLGEPIYTQPETTKPFNEFSLSPFIIQNLAKMNIEEAFSVQVTVVDLLLKDIRENVIQPDPKGDLLVNAATGSGKTLSYSIPILEALHKRVVPRVRAIVLVPTKPLTIQVKATISALAKGTNLSIVSLRSDISVKEEAAKHTKNVPDVIISTPGRIVEHIMQDSIDLKSLRFLVIDEADRLLNQSFQNWCQILISKLDSDIDISKQWKLSLQKLIFSATLTTDAGKLSLLKLNKPRVVIVNNRRELVNELFNVPTTLNEYVLQFGSSKSSSKPLILAKFLISQSKLANILVFTKSNESSLRLSRLLQLLLDSLAPNKGLKVAYMNSTNNTATSRTKILSGFSKQEINILVATDLIARGIDILSITDVINYDIPNSSREYVHRVGRTARANKAGSAYSICIGKGEKKWFAKLKSDIGRGDKEVAEFNFDLQENITSEDEIEYRDCLSKLQEQVFSRA